MYWNTAFKIIDIIIFVVLAAKMLRNILNVKMCGWKSGIDKEGL